MGNLGFGFELCQAFWFLHTAKWFTVISCKELVVTLACQMWYLCKMHCCTWKKFYIVTMADFTLCDLRFGTQLEHMH